LETDDPARRSLVNSLQAGIRDATKDDLGKSGFYYFLSGVNAGVPQYQGPSSTNFVLKPRKFCFTIASGADGESGTLITWIAVEGGVGNLSPGFTSVTFHPSDHDRTPIPAGNSASIIFRHDLIASNVFQVRFSPMARI
jgi:hypothetical protein